MVLAMTACKTGVGTLCTVTFDADNGSALVTQTVESGKSVEKPSPDPVKDGFNFGGWYLGDTAYNFSSAVTEDITLKAKWNKIEPPAPPKPVKVFYDANGGTFDIEYEELFAGDSLTDQLPSKKRVFFTGWYDAADGGNKLSVVPSTNGKDITVYAHWDKSLTSDEGRLTVSYIDGEEGVELTVRALRFESNFNYTSCEVNESTTGLSVVFGQKEYGGYFTPQLFPSSSSSETTVKFPFVKKGELYQFTLTYGTKNIPEHTETVSFISTSTGDYSLSDYLDVETLKKVVIECQSDNYTAKFSNKGKTFFNNKSKNFANLKKAWGTVDVISGSVAGTNNVSVASFDMALKSVSVTHDISSGLVSTDGIDVVGWIESYAGDGDKTGEEKVSDLALNPTWYCEGSLSFMLPDSDYTNIYTLGGLFKPESGKEAKSNLYGKKASASLTVTFEKSPYEDLDVTYTTDSSNSKKITFTLNDPKDKFNSSSTYWYVGDVQKGRYKTYTCDFSSYLPGSYPVRVSSWSGVDNNYYEKLLIVKINGTED